MMSVERLLVLDEARKKSVALEAGFRDSGIGSISSQLSESASCTRAAGQKAASCQRLKLNTSVSGKARQILAVKFTTPRMHLIAQLSYPVVVLEAIPAELMLAFDA
jgi:hypothetical protein